jgi:hypothetical protein
LAADECATVGCGLLVVLICAVGKSESTSFARALSQKHCEFGANRSV